MRQDEWIKNAQIFYDNEAESKKTPEYSQTFCRAYRKIADILPLSPKSSLLDVGCGCGEMAEALQGKLGHYFGIDASQNSLNFARERNADSFFGCADMTALPFSAGFDFVTAMTCLEFVFNKPAALKEIKRVLRDSGTVYVEVRNADFLPFKLLSPFMKQLTKLGLIIPYETEGFRDLGFEEWNNLLTAAGFQVIGYKKSIRSSMYGNLVTRAKNTLIKIIRSMVGIKYHYIVGFLCMKNDSLAKTIASSSDSG